MGGIVNVPGWSGWTRYSLEIEEVKFPFIIFILLDWPRLWNRTPWTSGSSTSADLLAPFTATLNCAALPTGIDAWLNEASTVTSAQAWEPNKLSIISHKIL